MLYHDDETNISKSYLSNVAASVPRPLCLLGGWAVYLLANENFQKQHGSEYHGSKDIDLGYYFESDGEDKKSLLNSLFNKSLIAFENNGFMLQGFRLVQIYHRERRKPLTEEESKKIAFHNLFYLYVDLLVNRIPKNISEYLNITPIDEPMITQIFEKKLYKIVNKFGVEILLPYPEVILATKLNSVLQRTKDHKRIKDIADIYALIWYTNTEPRYLQRSVAKLITQNKIDDIISSFTDRDLKSASQVLGVNVNEMRIVLNSFIQVPRLKLVSSDNIADAQAWRIPINMNFEKLKIIINSIYQKGGDQKEVSLIEIIKTSGLVRKTVSANLLFFSAIGFIEGKNDALKFTSRGTQFAKALIQKNDQEIKAIIKDVVQNTYLKDIIDYIRAHDEKISLLSLCLFIKSESRSPDGKSFGNMHAPNSTGAIALLTMLNFAELLPQNVSEEILHRTQDSTTKASTTKVRKKSAPKKSKTSYLITEDEDKLPPDCLGRFIAADVGYVDIKNLDTLNIARKYFEVLEKKINAIQ